MRIAYVCADIGVPVLESKGAAAHVRELADGFRELGHEVTVLAARLGTGPRPAGFECIEVPDDSARRFFAGSASQARERRASWANASWTRMLERLHAGATFDVIYERYSLWSRAGAAFARRHGVPLVLEVNSPLRLEQQQHRTLFWEHRAVRVERYVHAVATTVVAVSDGVQRYLAALGHGSKTRVVPNGVSLRLYEGARYGGRRTRFTVGFVGSLKPWHGLANLLAAAAATREHVPDLRVLVVGDGPERQRLEADAALRGLADVIQFTGAVPKAEVAACLAQMDVATAPYPEIDEFYFSPLKVFEYMAAGRPIVASAIGQIADVLEHGRTALLAEPGNVESLAEQILTLFRNPSLAHTLASSARAEAVARHSWTKRASAILEHLDVARRQPSARAGTSNRIEVAQCRE